MRDEADSCSGDKKPHQKSGRQREKARIRQFERRKSSRQKERHLKGVESPADTSKNEVDVTKEADQKEPTPPLLHHTQSDQPPTRKELATRCRTALESIFERDLKLEGDDKGEDVLETMYREVRRLRHERKKQLEVVERRKFGAKRKIPEDAYGFLIRTDPSQARDEILSGICGGSVDLEMISQNPLLQLSWPSREKEEMERQNRGLNALLARRARQVDKEKAL